MSALAGVSRWIAGTGRRPAARVSPLSGMDRWLLAGVLILMGLGLVMVFSASAARAAHDSGNAYYFLLRQAVYVLISVVAMLAMARIPVDFWRERGPFLLLISLIFLLVVLIPGIGLKVNASQRWLNLVLFRFQPSEFFKFALLVFMAGYILRRGRALGNFSTGLLPVIAILGVAGALLLLEPDLGALVIAAVIIGGMLFVGGLPLRYMVIGGIVVGGALLWLAIAEPYRLARMTAFRDPWAHPLDSGFQLIQSLIAFGRGGVFGVGLGEGVQKLFYLPEAHTDFILAILGEELGLVGVLAVMGLCVLVTVRLFLLARMAEKAAYPFEALLCYGVMIWFAVQSLASMGVNLGALPTKGLTMPLMSYGGSSLLFMAMAMGVALGVSVRIQPTMKRGRA